MAFRKKKLISLILSLIPLVGGLSVIVACGINKNSKLSFSKNAGQLSLIEKSDGLLEFEWCDAGECINPYLDAKDQDFQLRKPILDRSKIQGVTRVYLVGNILAGAGLLFLGSRFKLLQSSHLKKVSDLLYGIKKTDIDTWATLNLAQRKFLINLFATRHHFENMNYFGKKIDISQVELFRNKDFAENLAKAKDITWKYHDRFHELFSTGKAHLRATDPKEQKRALMEMISWLEEIEHKTGLSQLKSHDSEGYHDILKLKGKIKGWDPGEKPDFKVHQLAYNLQYDLFQLEILDTRRSYLIKLGEMVEGLHEIDGSNPAKLSSDRDMIQYFKESGERFLKQFQGQGKKPIPLTEEEIREVKIHLLRQHLKIDPIINATATAAGVAGGGGIYLVGSALAERIDTIAKHSDPNTYQHNQNGTEKLCATAKVFHARLKTELVSICPERSDR